jgi:hypothetical protein
MPAVVSNTRSLSCMYLLAFRRKMFCKAVYNFTYELDFE